MNPVRRMLSSLLIEAAHKNIDGLDAQSACAKELREIEDVDAVITETAEKICQAATSIEISKIIFLAAQLTGTTGQKRETTKNDLKKIADVLIERVEAESGPLKLPQSCRLVFAAG